MNVDLIFCRAQFSCICFETGDEIAKGNPMLWDKSRSLVYTSYSNEYKNEQLIRNNVSKNSKMIRR